MNLRVALGFARLSAAAAVALAAEMGCLFSCYRQPDDSQQTLLEESIAAATAARSSELTPVPGDAVEAASRGSRFVTPAAIDQENLAPVSSGLRKAAVKLEEYKRILFGSPRSVPGSGQSYGGLSSGGHSSDSPYHAFGFTSPSGTSAMMG